MRFLLPVLGKSNSFVLYLSRVRSTDLKTSGRTEHISPIDSSMEGTAALTGSKYVVVFAGGLMCSTNARLRKV